MVVQFLNVEKYSESIYHCTIKRQFEESSSELFSCFVHSRMIRELSSRNREQNVVFLSSFPSFNWSKASRESCASSGKFATKSPLILFEWEERTFLDRVQIVSYTSLISAVRANDWFSGWREIWKSGGRIFMAVYIFLLHHVRVQLLWEKQIDLDLTCLARIEKLSCFPVVKQLK